MDDYELPRFIVRGYFTGDGQHWFAVYDRREGQYVGARGYPDLWELYADASNAKQRIARGDYGQYSREFGHE
jgi:hypothetical protein